MEPTSANRQIIPNNKPDIVIRDNKKKLACCSSWRHKRDQERSCEYFKM